MDDSPYGSSTGCIPSLVWLLCVFLLVGACNALINGGA
jgi:hypothetical protein